MKNFLFLLEKIAFYDERNVKIFVYLINDLEGFKAENLSRLVIFREKIFQKINAVIVFRMIFFKHYF